LRVGRDIAVVLEVRLIQALAQRFVATIQAIHQDGLKWDMAFMNSLDHLPAQLGFRLKTSLLWDAHRFTLLCRAFFKPMSGNEQLAIDPGVDLRGN
jgi:hypothetical protein